MKKVLTSIVILMLFISLSSWAQERSYEKPEGGDVQQGEQDSQGGRWGRRGMGPPSEAISACEGQAEGVACSFESPRGDVSGTCRKPPQRDDLICVPNNHHGRHRRGNRNGQDG